MYVSFTLAACMVTFNTIDKSFTIANLNFQELQGSDIYEVDRAITKRFNQVQL